MRSPLGVRLAGGGCECGAVGGEGPDMRSCVARVEGAKKNSLEAEASRLFSRTEILVRLAGFEPTTPWFVAKYSIQLSYSRVRVKL